VFVFHYLVFFVSLFFAQIHAFNEFNDIFYMNFYFLKVLLEN